jgi:hypothetical protein
LQNVWIVGVAVRSHDWAPELDLKALLSLYSNYKHAPQVAVRSNSWVRERGFCRNGDDKQESLCGRKE